MSSALQTLNLELRLEPHLLDYLTQVAALHGKTVGALLKDLAREAAEGLYARREVTVLSERDTLKLAQLLLEPPTPNEALQRAIESHSRLVVPPR